MRTYGTVRAYIWRWRAEQVVAAAAATAALLAAVSPAMLLANTLQCRL